MNISKEKWIALVNGIAYSVPANTTLANLEKYLPFSLKLADVIEFITCESISVQLFPKETYVSPFTGEVV